MIAETNFFVCVVRFFARSIIPLSFSIMLGLNIAAADPLSLFTSYAYVGDSVISEPPIGPIPGPLIVPIAYDISAGGGEYYVNENAELTTTFGQGIGGLPRIQKADVGTIAATAFAGGSDASAYAGGYVQYVFTVLTYGSPPFTSNVNVLISAIVNTHTEDGGDASETASAVVNPPSVAAPLTSSPSEPTYFSTSFLATPGTVYSISIDAFAAVSSGEIGEGSASATIDPTIALDQDAFNTLYGTSAFTLADYYTLQFSPNVPVVPEPATMLLLGSGLIGLAGLWRKFKK